MRGCAPLRLPWKGQRPFTLLVVFMSKSGNFFAGAVLKRTVQ